MKDIRKGILDQYFDTVFKTNFILMHKSNITKNYINKEDLFESFTNKIIILIKEFIDEKQETLKEDLFLFKKLFINHINQIERNFLLITDHNYNTYIKEVFFKTLKHNIDSLTNMLINTTMELSDYNEADNLSSDDCINKTKDNE